MTLSLDRWLLTAVFGVASLVSSRAETPPITPEPSVAAAVAPVGGQPADDARVANQKREIMEALKKSIDFYRKQREERKAQLLHPTYLNVTDEDLKRDIATLDARVEERVDQIMQITASLAQDTDYDQYDRCITDNNGNRRVNREVRQAENSTKRAVNAKGDVADGLAADKAKLEAEIAKLESNA